MLAAFGLLDCWLVVPKEKVQDVNMSRTSALALVATIARLSLPSNDV